ncbi:Eco57I restriction-modification methylase domain-containing protein [Herbidospora daliensis]|uniref:Eco57I restriction-modification methylase domain-containing protein n=1 Tax=Herbidospora daliensis TaxID=295585 RepID=UPI00078199C3|nr:DNA methyltransferase [Herbidospora daliensis]
MSQAGWRKQPDASRVHQDWLSLVEVSGPFLSLPVLRRTWPSLDPLDKAARERLRLEHGTWQADGLPGDWILYVLRHLLGWEEALHTTGLDTFSLEVPQHDTWLTPDFALVTPGEEAKPGTVRLLGLISDDRPTARVKGDAWAATTVDRLAQLCRHHDVELGLATDGRWWTLVWAPRGGVTTSATFDAISWPEAAERDVVRAFVSLLSRARFFSYPDDETLVALLKSSKDNQEDITEALGVQVRQAVELLVAAIGRAGIRDREAGGPGIDDVEAHDVYRGAVTVMMRIVFVLFAEERGLLPSDNQLYATAYSAGGLCAELEQRALEGSENDLEQTQAAWHRLLALFNAVYAGIDHPRLKMHAHDGSMFDPDVYAWLPLSIDDRTVLHMLKAVQYVQIGTRKTGERRKLSFRELDVEQIGYVYEGLLSFEGRRATDTVVGLVGKSGLEEEVDLSDLQRLAAQSGGELAARLAEKYKSSGIGTASAVAKRLAPLSSAERVEALRKLLAVTGGDRDLAEQVLPFYGILRHDLRELPVVILNGALYVTESALRKNTGTHYTPRDLAEQVVEGALEPLVYRIGPLQTADQSKWEPKSSAEILELKVADIAMGSAAFLVAAARYLSRHLVEAWSREEDPRAVAYRAAGSASSTGDADQDPVVVEAIRQIIEHCLYGVDINPMAVEMAKLSLWLVSMDRERPFTFLDDRLVAGDSLLGITSLDQLEVMHMDPKRGREIHEKRALRNFAIGARDVVREVAKARRKLAGIQLGSNPMAALATKRSILADAELKTSQARLFADLVVGAALAYASRGDIGLRSGSIGASDFVRRIRENSPRAELEAREQCKKWLNRDRVSESFERRPIHWPLVFPEVFDRDLCGRGGDPGFDAIIGNPPFLGGTKITAPLGVAYREYLVEGIAGGVRAGGRCDLVAYFVLRAHSLITSTGQVGVIATNTLAQGDTREVGLGQLLQRGITIRRAIKSKPWPSKSATLEYCAIWTTGMLLGDKVKAIKDDVAVPMINSSLDADFQISDDPSKLQANDGTAYQGSKLDGIGFAMDPDVAGIMIDRDSRNSEVLFPFLNGQDLNSDPDCIASRWVVNFRDWEESKARSYTDPYDHVVRLVKPVRANHSEKRTREAWWRYQRSRPELYEAISRLDRVIALTRVSKLVMPAMVHTGQVISEAVVVFATDDTAMLALLSSAQHYWWARARASSMKADLRYTPSDVFETLPLPELTQEMRDIGQELDVYRRNLMLSRKAGLTVTYNMVNDPANTDEDIVDLRRIHRAIDEAVCRAYAWDDLIDKLEYGHRPVARETRYTVGPTVQREFVDRLLKLNHERYADEVARGLHDKARKRAKRAADETLF